MSATVLGRTEGHIVAKAIDTKIVVARNLRALMDERKWSERRVGEKSGLSQKAVNKVLNLDSAPTSDTLDKLAKAFGLAAWQLTLPIPTDQLSDSGKFSTLLNHYLAASPDSRAEIARVAEREAKYRK